MDINISANTLFHFTSNRQSLLNILSNGFYSRYSLENFESLIDDTAEIVFPMVCFCDIPLSQVKRHTNTYGKYAIGLTKQWGMENKINPVIYTYPNSTTANLLGEISGQLGNFFDISEEENKKIAKTRKSNKKEDFFYELKKFLNDPTFKYKAQAIDKVNEIADRLGYFIKYIKPYEGKFFRQNAYLENSVKFYEEREWRYVPEKKIINSAKLKDSYKAEYYKDPIKRRAINIKLAKHSKLEFRPNDIRFIIVQKDSEIPEMLNELEKIFETTATSKDLKILGTRLISLQQIIEDI